MSVVFSAAANLSPLFSSSSTTTIVPRSLATWHKFPHTSTYPEGSTRFHQNPTPLSCGSFKSRVQNSLKSDHVVEYPKVGARSTGPIAPTHLIEVVKTAAQTGAQVGSPIFFPFLSPLHY